MNDGTTLTTQTKVDFTLMHGMLFAMLIGLICFGVLMLFFYSAFLHVMYATMGAMLFSAYLVYDIQARSTFALATRARFTHARSVSMASSIASPLD